LHPTNTNEEIQTVIYALNEISKNYKKMALNYNYSSRKNEFYPIKKVKSKNNFNVDSLFLL